MELNNFIFQNPEPSYTIFHENLYKIPRTDYNDKKIDSNKKGSKLPFIFLKNKNPVKNAIIFFHGNAEDAAKSIDLLNELNDYLNVSV